MRQYTVEDAPTPEQKEKMGQEFGDVMFSLINYSRFLELDPEAALEKTNKKFIARFKLMEEFALEEKRSLKEMSLSEMDALWNRAKIVYR